MVQNMSRKLNFNFNAENVNYLKRGNGTAVNEHFYNQSVGFFIV